MTDLNMTLNELLKGRCSQKVELINILLANLREENKAYPIDEENTDCYVSKMYYDEEKDEVFCSFENLPYDYDERQEEMLIAL